MFLSYSVEYDTLFLLWKLKKRQPKLPFLCRRWVIFPGRLQPSIVTVNELNYCVRNGNRCTLVTINTYLLFFSGKEKLSKRKANLFLTSLPKESTIFYCPQQLFYYNITVIVCQDFFGDPWENRTPVCGVRGRRLDRLTNGPHLVLTL